MAEKVSQWLDEIEGFYMKLNYEMVISSHRSESIVYYISSRAENSGSHLHREIKRKEVNASKLIKVIYIDKIEE